MTQRIKEELQDIAHVLKLAAACAPTNEQYCEFMNLVQRIREAGTLITADDRIQDAKRQALEACERFTELVNEGAFE